MRKEAKPITTDWRRTIAEKTRRDEKGDSIDQITLRKIAMGKQQKLLNPTDVDSEMKTKDSRKPPWQSGQS